MKLFRQIKNFCFDPRIRHSYLLALGAYNHMSDEEYLKKTFKLSMGYPLNLDNPQTFNEKLQWLKLHDRKPIYTTMVDKFEAKKYVASIIGEKYIIPTLGVWDDPNKLDFNALPEQFVLKCTHNSGRGMYICKDKSQLTPKDIKKIRKDLSKGLAQNYYLTGREWPYKNVPPRIIAEKYMQDTDTAELRDYKFFCFGGVAKCYKVDFDRFVEHKANYFSADGELMRLGEEVCPPDFERNIQAPVNLGKMKELAAKLSEVSPFLRTDFYEVDGNVYFGELTFYPASGFGKFIYDGNDELLGTWIKLPNTGGGYCIVYRDMLCVLTLPRQKSSVLSDYKIYTFNGKAKLCMINQDRGIHTRADYFDRDYNWLAFGWGYDHADVLPAKPKNYEQMFELAEKLAAGTTELRVDFYEVNGQIYFGELTFFDGSGFDKIEPIEWDYKIGNMLKLPTIQ